MNIDKSYGVDNLMLSKEQRFLILEMIADRELLEQAIGSRGYDKFKFDGLNKIDDTIRNRIATLKFYFPEEFHMLNQELLGIFDNSLQRELGYNKAHICIKKEFNFDGFISEWVAWTKQIARTPLKSFQSNLHKYTETERSWVQTFQDIIKCFDKSDERLWSVVESLWRDTLTPFDTDGIYDKFGLLVSLGDGQFTSNRYPIISSSLITDEFNYTYQSEFRRIGWCFSLNPYRVIGMSPVDTTSAEGGSPIPRYLDAAEINLASKSFISLEKSVIINEYDCLRFLSPYALIHKESTMYESQEIPGEHRKKYEGCNEIVFEGTHKPSGVFVIDTEQDCTVTAGEFYPYINDYLKRARVIAEAFRLPLVIYQKKTNRVQIITKDTYMKKPLQF